VLVILCIVTRCNYHALGGYRPKLNGFDEGICASETCAGCRHILLILSYKETIVVAFHRLAIVNAVNIYACCAIVSIGLHLVFFLEIFLARCLSRFSVLAGFLPLALSTSPVDSRLILPAGHRSVESMLQ